MRIVITGGTGFVGSALVKSLLGRGDHVIVLSRGKAKAPVSESGGTLEQRPWTPEEPGEWSNVVDGADAIVHLAGAGVMDERGNVAGLMPHPERAVEAVLGSDDGMRLFRALVEGAAASTAGATA